MPPIGSDALLEVLAGEGVRHVFGNPGTTELPFVDALAGRDEPRYVLALQELVAVGMADGYAQVTGRPAFVNLHTSAGLGNAIGGLTNARANGTPLVVTAGNADRRHLAVDPMLSGDLVGLARGTTTWAAEVRHADELATVVRRAFRTAEAPPRGPVFVSIPSDVLDEEVTAPVPPRTTVDHRSVAGSLPELARLLAEPGPGGTAIVAGEEVVASGAVGALVAVAEALGAPVYGAPLHASATFPPDHPLYAGMLLPRAEAIRGALSAHRRVLVVGDQAFLVYPWSPGSPVPDGTDLLHLAPTASAPGRAHAALLGVVGDPRASLEALLPLVRAEVAAGGRDGDVAAALDAARTRRAAEIARFDDAAAARYADRPMHPQAAAHALVRSLPEGTPVVDEAITTGFFVRWQHLQARPDTYLFCRGGGLGWGMPAACGVSLGRDRSPVLCVVGDGSAMYAPQALWTAAHEGLPVVFAVVDNRRYQILVNGLRERGRASAKTGRFVGMELDDPPLDFIALAKSMGVPSSRVESAAEVGDALRTALAAGGPHVLHLPIARPT